MRKQNLWNIQRKIGKVQRSSLSLLWWRGPLRQWRTLNLNPPQQYQLPPASLKILPCRWQNWSSRESLTMSLERRTSLTKFWILSPVRITRWSFMFKLGWMDVYLIMKTKMQEEVFYKKCPGTCCSRGCCSTWWFWHWWCGVAEKEKITFVNENYCAWVLFIYIVIILID